MDYHIFNTVMIWIISLLCQRAKEKLKIHPLGSVRCSWLHIRFGFMVWKQKCVPQGGVTKRMGRCFLLIFLYYTKCCDHLMCWMVSMKIMYCMSQHFSYYTLPFLQCLVGCFIFLYLPQALFTWEIKANCFDIFKTAIVVCVRVCACIHVPGQLNPDFSQFILGWAIVWTELSVSQCACLSISDCLVAS